MLKFFRMANSFDWQSFVEQFTKPVVINVSVVIKVINAVVINVSQLRKLNL